MTAAASSGGRALAWAAAFLLAVAVPALGQDAATGRGDIGMRGAIADDAVKRGSPAPQRSATETGATTRAPTGQVTAVALVTEDGQRIDQGVTWRVFQPKAGSGGKPKLISQHREASPVLRLPAGEYVITAAYGRANLPRRITVQAGRETTEQFVLNAGALRVKALISATEAAPAGSSTFDIFSDERDQFGKRARIVAGAKPGIIYRLNSGAYYIQSRYGDVNALASSDVTVEPGKLTDVAIAHAAAKVTFKLVTRAGGDALADTQWSIATPTGEVLKESAGALPTHTLAPGTYLVSAKSAGRVYQRTFTVRRGETAQIEVLMQ